MRNPRVSRTAQTALWRDVHKGIRSGLAILVVEAGAADPFDSDELTRLVDLMALVFEVMDSHAAAEDAVTAPVIEYQLPEMAAEIAAQHAEFDARIQSLVQSAEALDGAENPRAALSTLYLDLAAFTGAYFAHIDFEERVVLPALEDAMGLEAVRELDAAFVASIPAEEKLDGMGLMFPAMNVEERVEVLSTIKEHAPKEWFDQVWEVVEESLDPDDADVLTARLASL